MLDLPAQAGLCDTIPLRLIVKNTGTASAERTLIRHTLPQGLQTESGHNQITWDAGTLQPGQSRGFLMNLIALQIWEASLVRSS